MIKAVPSRETKCNLRVLGAGASVILVSLIGFGLSWIVSSGPIGQRGAGANVFYHLYGAHEQPFFLLIGTYSVIVTFYFLRQVHEQGRNTTNSPWPRIPPALMAAVVFGIALWGTEFVLLGYPLSMDEFNAVFQSQIFASGRITAPVPPSLAEFVPAMKPLFVTYKPDEGVWLSSYLPVYAAIRAPFAKFGIDAVVNPLLGALSIVTLAATARRLWPSDHWAGSVGVLLLATSSQFMLTSMGWYSMPAHLFLNLCWLLLYVRGGLTDLLLAPWVGALAIGLHNPLPHALFVAPFLVRLLRSRRYRIFGYHCTVYSVASLLWIEWLRFSLAPIGEAASRALEVPGLSELLTQVMSLSLVLSWQQPMMGLALFVGFFTWRHLSSVERDLALGILLSFSFYAFFPSTQGHGWGYRYVYSVLGSGALLSVSGLRVIRNIVGDAPTTRALVASCLAAVVIQIPARMRQAEDFVRPWALANEAMGALTEAAVVLPTASVWYGSDLIRNDAFLSTGRPISFAREALDADRYEHLVTQMRGRVRTVEASELMKLGLDARNRPPNLIRMPGE